jgi:hypothetical protein
MALIACSRRIQTTAPSTRVNLGAAVPIFRVEKLDLSVAYHIERIGFQLQWRRDPASVSRDRTPIMLSEGDQGQPGRPDGLASDAVSVGRSMAGSAPRIPGVEAPCPGT